MRILNAKVKQAADRGDRNRIKFVFLDSLDVDPTFEDYIEEFEYCKNKGLFDAHQNMTELRLSNLDESYWFALKKDFKKNPSIERLNHMRRVAKVLFADKVRRLEHERAGVTTIEKDTYQSDTAKVPTSTVREVSGSKLGPNAQKQQEELERLRAKYKAENQKTEKISAQTAPLKGNPPSYQRTQNHPKEDGMNSSLILAAGAAVVAVIASIMFLKR